MSVSRLPGAPRLGALLRPEPAVVPAQDVATAPLSPRPYCPVEFRPSGPDVWSQRVPAAVVAASLAPGTCLTVGDRPGDPDCFLSSVAWARVRRGLGLQADAHVGAVPPRQIKALLGPDELLSEDAVRARRYDTVILFDNDGTRVSPAALEAVRAAKRVVVVDHHDVHPTHETLGLPKQTELIVWKEPDADAAALMAMGMMVRALEETGTSWTREGWQHVLGPMVAAVYSDTRGFEAGKTRPSTLALLRGIVDAQELDLGALLRDFQNPIPWPLRSALLEQVVERTEQHGSRSLGTFELPGSAILDTWLKTRAAVPDLTWSDVLFTALDHFELRVRDLELDVGVMAVSTPPEDRERLPIALRGQLPPAQTKFSIRSAEPAVAARLAAALGGKGKAHEAGGGSDAPADSVLADASAWMRSQAQLEAHARKWARGSI